MCFGDRKIENFQCTNFCWQEIQLSCSGGCFADKTPDSSGPANVLTVYKFSYQSVLDLWVGKNKQTKKHKTILDRSNINSFENTISVGCISSLYCDSPLSTIQFLWNPYGANFLKAYCSNIKNLNLNIKLAPKS